MKVEITINNVPLRIIRWCVGKEFWLGNKGTVNTVNHETVKSMITEKFSTFDSIGTLIVMNLRVWGLHGDDPLISDFENELNFNNIDSIVVSSINDVIVKHFPEYTGEINAFTKHYH